MTQSTLHLKAMTGDYPLTHALRHGQITSPTLSLEFADVKVANTAFKRTIRQQEFDFSELAIVTFLQAHDAGVPLALLPTVIVSRFQHPFLIYNAAKGVLRPEDLAGKRIGVRSYTVTTVAWLRGMLLQDHGVDPASIQWLTFEDSHLAEWRDPHNVVRVNEGKDLMEMLESGEIDAAVVAGPKSENPNIQTIYQDPVTASHAWHQKHGVFQINHMTVVKRSLLDQHPWVGAELFRMLKESKLAGTTDPQLFAQNLFGFDDVRPHLEFVIASVFDQGMIKQKYPVESLFHTATLLN